jgi:ribonuclease J
MSNDNLNKFLKASGLHPNQQKQTQPASGSVNTSPDKPAKTQQVSQPKPQGQSHATSAQTSQQNVQKPKKKFFRKKKSGAQNAPQNAQQARPQSTHAKKKPQGQHARPNRTQHSRPQHKQPQTQVRKVSLPQAKFSPHDVRIVPLGGLEQVGQNMMMIEWADDIIIIDTGIEFPSPEHLGVDVIVPDISYLKKNKKKIRGIVYTHGHLDHIGGAQYLVPDLGFPPMYATKLTKELLIANADNPETPKKYKISEINEKSHVRLGKFEVEFFHVNHSIPDNVGIVVKTPYGSIVHSSDFKIDPTPSDEKPADLNRIARIGDQGVAVALVDSTNALQPGHTVSESVIEKELEKTIRDIPGRIVIATFASNIGRVAKVIQAAEKDGRTVFLSGRSMERNTAIARKLKYLKCKDGTLKRMSKLAEELPASKVLILSTGTQGEELAALTRMAAKTHRDIKLTPADTVIFSSSAIPGNEMAIVSVLNNLADLGVKMLDNKQLDSHVSGHGHAEECKQFTSLLRPKYFAPIHGELFMRYGHRDMIVRDLNMHKKNTFIMKNGKGMVLSREGARVMTDKEAIPSPPVLIELGEEIGEQILSDRTRMADSGTIFVSVNQFKGKVKNVEVRARGFRHMNMEHEIFKILKREIKASFERNYGPKKSKKDMETMLSQAGTRIFYQKFKKEPLVEVVIA